MKNSKETGDLFKRRRKELGITQTQFAEQAGIATPTISMVENGKDTTREKTLKKICKELGISDQEFAEVSLRNTSTPPDKSAVEYKTEVSIFPFGLKIGQDNIEISPAVKEDIIKLIFWTLTTGILEKKDIDNLLIKRI